MDSRGGEGGQDRTGHAHMNSHGKVKSSAKYGKIE